MMKRRDAQKFGIGLIRLLVLGVFVLLAFGETFAQDATPQPPDPKTIFAHSVKVVETLPVLNFDNSTRQIQYFDPTTLNWKMYPYPAELSDDIVTYWPYGSGKYLLLTKLTKFFRDYKNYHDIEPQYFWVFDAPSGSFSRPAEQCGRIQGESGNGRWVLFSVQSGKVFCNTETGETTKPLPQSFNSDSTCTYDLNGGQLASSPDGEWLLFHDCTSPSTVYSYDRETNSIHMLGALENGSFIFVNDWYKSKTVTLFTFGEKVTDLFPVYVADVTQENSLKLIAPNAINNASKLFWGEVKDDTQANNAAMEIRAYDLAAQKSTSLLEYSCGKTRQDCVAGLIVVNPNESRVVIDDYHSEEPSKGLLVYDLASKKRVYESKAYVFSGVQILWANDHTLIYFDHQPNQKNLHIVKFDDTSTYQDFVINDVLETNLNAILSPDGKLLVVSNHNHVDLVSVATGKATTIASVSDKDSKFFAAWDKSSEDILSVSLNYLTPLSTSNWKIQIPDGIAE